MARARNGSTDPCDWPGDSLAKETGGCPDGCPWEASAAAAVPVEAQVVVVPAAAASGRRIRVTHDPFEGILYLAREETYDQLFDLDRLAGDYFRYLPRDVAEAQARGEVSKEVDPMACAQNLFGLYFLQLMTWLSGHATLEIALVPLLRDSIALQIRGFRP